MRMDQSGQVIFAVQASRLVERVLSLRSPRVGVAMMFLLNGALFGTWASRIPAVVERFDLTAQEIGLLLLVVAVGGVASFPLAGWSSDHFGPRSVSLLTAAAYVVALAAVGSSSLLWHLTIGLVLFGAAQGALDVSMNAWGARLEQDLGRPILSSLHAVFSLGAGCGSLCGYFATQMSMGIALHFVLVGGVLGLIALLLASGPGSPHVAVRSGPIFVLPKGPLLGVGVVVFCATLGEGAMADWSAVFLHTVTGVSEARSALGYAAFSAAMLAVRLCGDPLVARMGAVPAAQASGGVLLLGVLMVTAGSGFYWVLTGFGLMGVGYAIIAPLAFSRAAADKHIAPGSAIAGIATFGYGGLLLGPPVIGFVSEATSLPVGFLFLGGLACLIVLLAPYLDADATQKSAGKGG